MMGIWNVLNTLILVIGIGFWMYAVSNNIIHALAEQSRKNYELEMKLLDKWMDKLCKSIVDVFQQVKKIEDGNDPVSFTSYKTKSEQIKSQVDELWDDKD